MSISTHMAPNLDFGHVNPKVAGMMVILNRLISLHRAEQHDPPTDLEATNEGRMSVTAAPANSIALSGMPNRRMDIVAYKQLQVNLNQRPSIALNPRLHTENCVWCAVQAVN